MEFDIGVGGAFTAGVLSFFSPCVLPLVPPYLAFLTGLTLEQMTGDQISPGASRKILLSALSFVAGFATIFVILGATASYLGQLLAQYLNTLAVIAGILIIIMGLHFLGIFKIPLLYREARVHVAEKPTNLVGAYIIGLAFAFGWTPCVGPILTAILFVAGSEDTVFKGAWLLMAYALGIGIPFLVASAFAGPFIKIMRRFSRYLGYIEKTMGALLVITGILFITGSMNEIAFWLLEGIPSLGKIG